MKRRQLIQYAGSGLLATLGLSLIDRHKAQAQSGSVAIQYLGHSCFLFTGDGRTILVNPFRPGGCTAGYRAPLVTADLVMISSRLLDEGAVEELPGNPSVLAEPGVYDYPNMQVQGTVTPHDDLDGKRFGTNVIWRWQQGGVNIVHMGGAATPIEVEQQILLGRPDVLLLPVGGGPKAFTPEEAQSAILTLNPKLVIPTQYRTQAADEAACDILPIDNFLALMQGTPVEQAGSDTVTVSPASLPASTTIEVLSYAF